MQRDAVQHLDRSGPGAEAELEIADAQRRSAHSPAPRISRSASPTRLKPNTATRIARPGNTVSHQESGRYLAPSATIDPRSGVGGCTPSPRKDSDEAIRMTKPRSSVILVRIDGTQLGRISRNMTWAREAPIPSAAITSPSSFSERVKL